ncbi:hypothetical protein P5V15_011297 [Pogonomyrmex californicus]
MANAARVIERDNKTIEGKLTKNKVVDESEVMLGNNFVAFIFGEIRYELDGVEIDRNRNVGITCALKHYITTSSERSVILRNAAHFGERTILEHGFSLVGSIRVSAVIAYNQAFVSHQDRYSA